MPIRAWFSVSLLIIFLLSVPSSPIQFVSAGLSDCCNVESGAVNVFSFNITLPSTTNSFPIYYTPSLSSPSLVPDLDVPLVFLNYPLPSSAAGAPPASFACSPIGPAIDSTKYVVPTDTDAMAMGSKWRRNSAIGPVLVIFRGACPFDFKDINAAALTPTPSMVIIGSRSPTPAGTDAITGYIQGADDEPTLPMLLMSTDDTNSLAATFAMGKTQNGTLGSTNFQPPFIRLQMFGAGTQTSASDKAALVSIISTATQLQGTADDVDQAGYSTVVTSLVPSAIEAVDPCAQRVAGIWCEHGRITGIIWIGFNFGPRIDAAIGALSALKWLEIDQHTLQDSVSYPALPNELCTLGSLQFLSLAGNDVASAAIRMPNCFGTGASSRNLRMVNAFQAGLVSLPTVMSFPQLRWFDVSGNSITSLNPDAFHHSLDLAYLDVSSNLITSAFPNLTLNAAIQTLNMGVNQWSSSIPFGSLDHKPLLTSLDISFTAISGALPSFIGTPLVTLSLRENQFNGTLPAIWSDASSIAPTITSIDLRGNQLVGPIMDVISQLNKLQSLDLSSNRIKNDPPPSIGIDSQAAFWSRNPPMSLTSLDLSYNQLSGILISNSYINNAIQTLILSNNFITGSLPIDLFDGSTFVSIDLHSNKLDGVYPVGLAITSQITKFDISGNPLLRNDPACPTVLPAGMTFDTNQFVKSAGNALYYCPGVVATTGNTVLSTDASFYGYDQCQCEYGLFGAPPNCFTIPVQETINSYSTTNQHFSGVVDSTPNTISDQWYQNQRSTPGAITSWVFRADSYAAQNVNVNSTVQILVGAEAESCNSLQQLCSPPGVLTYPVRSAIVYLHIDQTVFNTSDQLIQVFAGVNNDQDPTNSDLTFIASIRGRDQLPNSVPLVTLTNEYVSHYGHLYSGFNSMAIMSVPLLGDSVTISFQSRDISGQHFVAIVDFAATCPPNDYLLDSESGTCVRVYPYYDEANTSMANGLYIIRITTIIITAIVLGFILITFAIMFRYRRSKLMRAASIRFVYLILVFELLLGTGAFFYAIIPYKNHFSDGGISASSNSSDWICSTRAWFSCIPLMGVMACIASKSLRLDVIFGMKKLEQINFTDWKLFQYVAALVGGQMIMVIIFQSRQLSLASVSLVFDSSTDTQYWVRQCSQESGFLPWIITQIVFFLIVMLATATLAYRARDVPSSFNETQQNSNTLNVMLTFLVILVPVDLTIGSNPVVAVLIQGLGQAFLVLMIHISLFGARILYIIQGKQDDPMLASKTNSKLGDGRTNSESGGTSRDIKSGSGGFSRPSSNSRQIESSTRSSTSLIAGGNENLSRATSMLASSPVRATKMATTVERNDDDSDPTANNNATNQGTNQPPLIAPIREASKNRI